MKHRSISRLRAAGIVATLLLCMTLLVGFIWDWVTALAFIIGGTFFTLCCFLSYYRRIAFSFNSIPDTNMSSMVAFLTNSIPKHETPPRPGSELDTFKPFTFKQDEEKVQEEKRVRALLRQVFPDGEISL